MKALLEKLLEDEATENSWGFIDKLGKIINPDKQKYKAHEDYAFEWLINKYGGKIEGHFLWKFYDETEYVRFSTTSAGGYVGAEVWTWGNITNSQLRTISRMARAYVDFHFDIYKKGKLLYGGKGFSDFREKLKKFNLLK